MLTGWHLKYLLAYSNAQSSNINAQLFACLNLSFPQEGLGSVPVQAETRGVPPLPLLLQEALPFHHQGHRREYGGDVVIMTCLMNSLCEIHSFILTNIAGDRGQLAGREAQPAAHQLPKREQQRSLLPPGLIETAKLSEQKIGVFSLQYIETAKLLEQQSYQNSK